MPSLKRLFYAVLTLVAAIASGWVLSATGLPLGWLIGAMLLVLTASLFQLPVVQPKLLMPYVKAAVGTMLGAAIPPDIAELAVAWWPSLSVMFGLLIVVGAINYNLLQYLFGFPKIDALLCSMPGGISEMILIGEHAGADQRRVAIVHSLRIALSILLIPLLAGLAFGVTVESTANAASYHMTIPDWGWFLACVVVGVAADRWLRIPAALILVPMVASAALHLTQISAFHVPSEVSIAIQVTVGINVGARFLGVSLSMLAGFAMSALAVIAIQISTAIFAAIVMAKQGGWDGLALTLAFAPGGLAEMSLIAVTMGREVALVACHHILRVLFALFTAPALVSLLSKRSQ
ncbi:AbrB family transcriptional regulator [Thalassospira alkalitolerans]|uniref:AbrB family transcriptional regulator n=1 Tax=Thalassospira alkalitolerans TaxID=1293890 RepID=UPI003AA8FD6C